MTPQAFRTMVVDAAYVTLARQICATLAPSGGTSLPFNGWLFGCLIKGATLSASQIALAERWLASKTKTVTLA